MPASDAADDISPPRRPHGALMPPNAPADAGPSDPDRRRRPGRVPRGRPRPAAPLRRAVPDRARGVRRVRAGRAARAEAARRPGRGDPGRLPDAADERHRVPRAGDGRLPGRPARAADRVRRHRARRSTRSTSSTSTTTCSSRGTRRRRSSTRCVDDLLEALAGRRPPAGARDQGRRAPLVGAVVRGARVPGPQPGAVPLVLRRRAGGAAAAGGGRRGRATAAAW